MIEKVEVKDIKTTIAAMVVGAQQRHAKRCRNPTLGEVGG